MEQLLVLVARFAAVVIILTAHEFAHAFVAYKCGDPTAKFSGRMSLNPARHFDLFGMLAFALIGFGWAKPVPVNPYNFKNYRWALFGRPLQGLLPTTLWRFCSIPCWFWSLFTCCRYLRESTRHLFRVFVLCAVCVFLKLLRFQSFAFLSA